MSVQRTRTSPEVKWLANELSVLAGEMEKIDDQVAMLRERRAKLQATREALGRVAELMELPALPGLVPTVRPFFPLGKRGSMRNFLRNELRDAYPGSLDTMTLASKAAERFDLRFATLVEFQRFRNRQVLKTLQKLADLGEVEGLHERRPGVNIVGVWRLKADRPTVAELRAMSTTAEAG